MWDTLSNKVTTSASFSHVGGILFHITQLETRDLCVQLMFNYEWHPYQDNIITRWKILLDFVWIPVSMRQIEGCLATYFSKFHSIQKGLDIGFHKFFIPSAEFGIKCIWGPFHSPSTLWIVFTIWQYILPGVDLYFFLALASRTGNLRKLPVRKRTYLPQFLGGNLKHKTRVAKGKKITGSFRYARRPEVG